MAENILNNFVESFAESIPKQTVAALFQEENPNSAAPQPNRLLKRQKTVHHVLGGGKSADVLLWRNKKISGSVLAGATAIWVLFEWLNYHFLTLLFIALVLVMLAQFVWASVSGFFSWSSSEVPRLKIPEELFVNIGMVVGSEVNRALGFLQDVASRKDLKQFLVVVASLWAAAIIGSWCNFLTVLYVGFVAMHTLPVLYEQYEDQVDSFVSQLLGQFRNHYQKLDAGIISKIAKAKLNAKKHE
ncbi:reticulon-like protein B8 [Eucalyptus grandis]|uniref:reticulon-like protein B8 n=1 Tax=Eucalyptus grandis TaxID=71139 RepID=UPI00192E7861|nr:reticulon-like protein B8 [Eucalyptus grandis]